MANECSGPGAIPRNHVRRILKHLCRARLSERSSARLHAAVASARIHLVAIQSALSPVS